MPHLPSVVNLKWFSPDTDIAFSAETSAALASKCQLSWLSVQIFKASSQPTFTVKCELPAKIQQCTSTHRLSQPYVATPPPPPTYVLSLYFLYLWLTSPPIPRCLLSLSAPTQPTAVDENFLKLLSLAYHPWPPGLSLLLEPLSQCCGSGSVCFWASWIRMHI